VDKISEFAEIILLFILFPLIWRCFEEVVKNMTKKKEEKISGNINNSGFEKQILDHLSKTSMENAKQTEIMLLLTGVMVVSGFFQIMSAFPELKSNVLFGTAILSISFAIYWIFILCEIYKGRKG
jgi:hypothetical protein